MKYCAVIAEYNPFHNGHLKQIEYIKNELKAEKIIVIMSGNFTQRGEPAVSNKFKRAVWAINSGADAVIELPTVFATASAEIFACGAVKILNGLNFIDGLCFGVENGEKEDFISLATALNSENKELKKAIKENLDKGWSFVKSKFEAVKSFYKEDFDEKLISSPNNILGVEYARAVLSLKSNIELFPLKREGDHNSTVLSKGISSASSIRETLKTGKTKKVKSCVPDFVYKNLDEYPFSFDKIIMSDIIKTDERKLKKILDCTEGLENRIKALVKDNKTVDSLIEKATTKRYTSSRIRRILISSLLNIDKDLVQDCLSEPLYAKFLAVKKESKNEIYKLAETSSIPFITRKSDIINLGKTAVKCFDVDTLSVDLYNLATNERENEYQTVIV